MLLPRGGHGPRRSGASWSSPATSGELYNVGSQERIAIRDLAERVRAKVASSSEIVFVPYEEVYPHGSMEEMFHREPSIEKIGAAIGWAPTRTLDDILDDVVAYERDRVEAAGLSCDVASVPGAAPGTGSRRGSSRGPESSIARRSMPRPRPPVGGMPYESAST